MRYVFCREVKPEPLHVEPLQVDVNWQQWRTPKHMGPPRAQSSEKMEEIRRQVKRMQQLDLIEPSRSLYYSHVHLVRKPNGKWRYCINFRNINDLCGNIGWPIPSIAQALQRIGSRKPKFFAKFDFLMAFARMATSFIYLGRAFRWKCVPMGWKSAGAHFQQQLAHTVLSGLLYSECELYIADILAFAS
jgi:hypothetical protein